MTANDDPASGFYDRLAADYHLIHIDWNETLKRQAALLDRLITARVGPGPHRLLDCACGIGTQAIGLAALGHEVHASDISAESVARADREARERGVALTTSVADMRRLGTGDGFDVVLACDNPLAHLPDDANLDAAAAGMAAALAPGGLLLASSRDYDAIAADRPDGQPPRVMGEAPDRRIVFQLWDWEPDGRAYRAELFILREDGDAWITTSEATRLRAWPRAAIGGALERAGLTHVEWLASNRTGYYQQIVTARKPDG